MNKRLKMIRNDLKMSGSEFGDRLGITAASVSRYESGQRNISTAMVKSICNEFGISENWFMTGSGNMYTVSDGIKSGSLSDRQKIVNMIYGMNEKQIDTVISFIELIKDMDI